MQWKQIKTLFILCFLILDVYLAVLIINKQDETEVASMDTAEKSFEQQLDSEDIAINADLPDKSFEESNVELKQKSFTEHELAFFDDIDNQQTKLIDNKLILSRFDEPVSIPDGAGSDKLTKLMKDRVPFFDDYTFGGWNEDMNVLMFFQTKNDVPIYYNQNGILLVYLDDDNDMLFYTQTMLVKQNSPTKDEPLIKPIGAIKKLFNSNRLEYGDKISDVSMGFYTRFPLEGEQVFSPTWTVTINNQNKLYVNAIENKIYPSDEVTFLTGAVTSTLEKLQTLEKDNELKAYMTAHLKNKLAMIQDSE
ncbi:two-component system regulatory protein YycI [Barrientosiimonas marina]|uniref:Two-component system regulatory protein YycI n=1 Tax=Lentibacillus kimchii TaxID=1542911 RepID=A0ABW2UU42_9BACI